MRTLIVLFVVFGIASLMSTIILVFACKLSSQFDQMMEEKFRDCENPEEWDGLT